VNGEVRDERGRLVYAPRSNYGAAVAEAMGDGPRRTTLHHNSGDATAARAKRPDEYGGRLSPSSARAGGRSQTALEVAKAPIVLPMRAPIRETRRR